MDEIVKALDTLPHEIGYGICLTLIIVVAISMWGMRRTL